MPEVELGQAGQSCQLAGQLLQPVACCVQAQQVGQHADGVKAADAVAVEIQRLQP